MYDHVLNIYFAQARMYNPTLRRFLAVDPIRGNIFNPQLMIPYTYVLNNPLRFVDPLGLSPHAVDLESFVEGAGGVINWVAGTATVGGQTQQFNVLEYGNSHTPRLTTLGCSLVYVLNVF